MAIYGAVRLDKVAAIAGGIESVKHNARLENGMVHHVAGLAAGEREVKSVVTPSTASILTDSILLHASPELNYVEGETILDFSVEVGKIGRSYHLEVGDIITVTDAVITGASVVGQFLIPANNSLKLTAAANLDGGTRFAARVLEKGSIYGQASTTFQVIKN